MPVSTSQPGSQDDDFFDRFDRERDMVDQTYYLTDDWGNKVMAFGYYTDPTTHKPVVVYETFADSLGNSSSYGRDGQKVFTTYPYTGPDGRRYYTRTEVFNQNSRDFNDWRVTFSHIDVIHEEAHKKRVRKFESTCNALMFPVACIFKSTRAYFGSAWILGMLGLLLLIPLWLGWADYPAWIALLPNGIPFVTSVIYHVWDIWIARNEHPAEAGMIAGLVMMFSLLNGPFLLALAGLMWFTL